MTLSLASLVRQNRFLYPRLRVLKYALWNLPLVGRVIPDPVELEQMEEIGRQSSEASMTGSGDGPRILFFTMRGWSYQTAWDATLAAALRQRGAQVSFYTCGKRLPICDIASHHASPPTPCSFCASYMRRALSAWRFSVSRLRDYVSKREIAQIRSMIASLPYEEYDALSINGLSVGQLVKTSVRWFMCSGTIGDDALARRAHRDFLASGAVMAHVVPRLLDAVQPDKLYVLNGLFFAEGILLAAARVRGVPVVTHEVGFLPNTQVFAHNRIAGHFDRDDIWPEYKDVALLAHEAEQLDTYLAGRRGGGQDAAKYYPSIEEDKKAIVQRLGLDVNKRLAVAFTNILWDSAVLDRNRAFGSMVEWLDETIKYFCEHDDVQLLIRVHPAEVRLSMQETREQVVPLLMSRHPNLSNNVKIIPPESDVSSYALMQMSDVGLVYTSTTGLEMSLLGKPVIVTGKTHYAGKGFTLDAKDRDDYLHLVGNIAQIEPLSPRLLEMARRYAYLFFFRTMLPVSAVTLEARARVLFNFGSLDDLAPGCFPDLDLIGDAVLNGTPFVQ